MTTVVTADTDLRPFIGMRVHITRELDGTRFDYYGRFESLQHSQLTPGMAGGILVEEPHGVCRGGSTGFALEYGNATITPAPTYTSLPEVSGTVSDSYDGRYRLWTISHGVDFDALPSYYDGGPAIVVIDGWHKSTSSVCRALSSPSVVAADDGTHVLNLWQGTATSPAYHELHGKHFPTDRDADRAAYNAGTTAFMVYERDAARFGLPTAADGQVASHTN